MAQQVYDAIVIGTGITGGWAAKELTEAGLDHRIVGDPTLFDVVFTAGEVRDYRDVFAADAGRNARFNAALRAKGIFKSPGKLYPSLALTKEDIAQTIEAIEFAAYELCRQPVA